MRKITKQAALALMSNKTWRSGNTKVVNKKLYLHNNLIASIEDSNTTIFTLAGWNTNTTRERLLAADIRVYTKKGQAYCIDENGVHNKISSNEYVKVVNGIFCKNI
jgi:hypothetical protein